jgi:hypothetical protein
LGGGRFEATLFVTVAEDVSAEVHGLFGDGSVTTGTDGEGSCLELLASDKLRPAVFRADSVGLGGVG